MFRQYPDIYYPFTDKQKQTYYRVLKDITVNLKLRRDLTNDVSLYEYYDLRDWESPDIIAAKYYGNAKWHYLVMLANDTFDWRDDYPLTQNQLDAYVKDVYVNPNGVHHYETVDGVIVPKPDVEAKDIVPITNYEYEYKLNESKRRIRLIRSDIAPQVVAALKDLL